MCVRVKEREGRKIEQKSESGIEEWRGRKRRNDRGKIGKEIERQRERVVNYCYHPNWHKLTLSRNLARVGPVKLLIRPSILSATRTVVITVLFITLSNCSTSDASVSYNKKVQNIHLQC